MRMKNPTLEPSVPVRSGSEQSNRPNSKGGLFPLRFAGRLRRAGSASGLMVARNGGGPVETLGLFGEDRTGPEIFRAQVLERPVFCANAQGGA
jgi:hypothetical protein